METAFRSLVAFMLVATLYVIVTRRVSRKVWTFSVQSVTLALYAALTALENGSSHLWALAGLTLLVKGILVPLALLQVLDRVQIRDQVDFLTNIPSSAILAGAVTLVGFSVADRVLPGAAQHSRAAFGAGASSLLVGLLVMITRKKIITKVVGLLFMENGAILAALGLTEGMPLLVELGIALDVLVAVQILAIYALRLRGGLAEVGRRRA